MIIIVVYNTNYKIDVINEFDVKYVDFIVTFILDTF